MVSHEAQAAVHTSVRSVHGSGLDMAGYACAGVSVRVCVLAGKIDTRATTFRPG